YTPGANKRPLSFAVVSGLGVTENLISPQGRSQHYTLLRRGASVAYGMAPDSGDDLSLFVYNEAAISAAPVNHLWQKSPLPFTVSASEAPDAPAARIADAVNPTRAYRSPTREAVQIVCDFGEQRIVRAIDLDHTNVGILGLAYSQDDSAYTTLVDPQTIAEDPVDHYRKHFLAAALAHFEEFAARYVRVDILLQETSDEAQYYYLGMVLFFESLQELSQNVSFTISTTKEQEMLRATPGGRPEVTRGGPAYVTFDMEQTIAQAAVAGAVNALAKLGEDVPFLLYLNQGDQSQAYWLQRDTAYRFDWNSKFQEQRIRFREVR
ncbi:MAG: hypothetical protein ACRDRT_00075, partial [Pseudonocardiaceae bacterium]